MPVCPSFLNRMNELVFHVLAIAVGEPMSERPNIVKIFFTEVSSSHVALS